MFSTVYATDPFLRNSYNEREASWIASTLCLAFTIFGYRQGIGSNGSRGIGRSSTASAFRAAGGYALYGRMGDAFEVELSNHYD